MNALKNEGRTIVRVHGKRIGKSSLEGKDIQSGGEVSRIANC